jgi:hypothetical protein
MSLAMYASPYDSPSMISDFEKNEKVRKTSRPKTQKNHSDKVNDVLLSINEETLTDFHSDNSGREDEVNLEEIQKTENDKKTYLLPDTIYIKKLNFK